MSDSDDEYVQDLSDDGGVAAAGSSNNYGTRSTGLRGRGTGGQPGRTKERWEDIQRSWDLVTEGADGSLAGTVEGLLEAGKRKRLLKDTTPLQRGIIRHMILVIDLSSAMSEKDLRPSRHLLTLRIAADFIREFFEQNPISQLGLLGMRDGLAIRLTDLSGNPAEHIAALAALRPQEPKGNPSLQNALEMARAALFHTPTHGTREVLIVFGALLTSDPGDIHQTIRDLVTSKIRVSVVGLAARIAICTELCTKTNGVPASDTNPAIYGICMHESHFRDLVFLHTTPPATRSSAQSSAPSLLMMGFPSRIEEAAPTLCACHARPSRGGYHCSRCSAKVCSLPAQCPTCDLQLIQSTHLARSYHHLFPLRNYEEVSWREARTKGSVECFACLAPFPTPPLADGTGKRGTAQKGGRGLQKGASESSRYGCRSCGEHFCVDCDVLAHEVVHNCAGCLCNPQVGAVEEADGNDEVHGGTNGNDEVHGGANGKDVGHENGAPGSVQNGNHQTGATIGEAMEIE